MKFRQLKEWFKEKDIAFQWKPWWITGDGEKVVASSPIADHWSIAAKKFNTAQFQRPYEIAFFNNWVRVSESMEVFAIHFAKNHLTSKAYRKIESESKIREFEEYIFDVVDMPKISKVNLTAYVDGRAPRIESFNTKDREEFLKKISRYVK